MLVGEFDLLRVDCPFAVCWVFGGGPRSVGDMLKLRTSRFLAAPGKAKHKKWKNVKSSVKFIIKKREKRNEIFNLCANTFSFAKAFTFCR